MSAAQDGRARAIEAATHALVKTGGDSEEYCRASARVAIVAALTDGGVVTSEVALWERQRERDRADRAEAVLREIAEEPPCGDPLGQLPGNSVWVRAVRAEQTRQKRRARKAIEPQERTS